MTWISVKDKEIPLDTDVLVWANGYYWVIILRKDEKEVDLGCGCYNGGEVELEEIKYWAELPPKLSKRIYL